MQNHTASAATPRPQGEGETAPDPDFLTVSEKDEAWLRDYATDIKISKEKVCEDHQSAWECFQAIRQRPSVALILGARGSGKSFLSALDTHLTSRDHPKHGTRILGGSKAQSEQIYLALRELASEFEGEVGIDSESIAKMRKDGATYANGADVAILAASSTSVRGPHVPSLKLDEVDEMDTDIRESAMGMCMGKRRGQLRDRLPASVIMTSTCHRVNGPMAHLIKKAEAGDFPLYTMCVFEVLERCPDERSGVDLEKCPECPISTYCRDVPQGALPKAKRSDGHYPIDSLIQKFKTTSVRTFEADYLCKLSSNEAAWFPNFQPVTHVSELAEYVPGQDVHLAVDTGVFTGAVLFQVLTEQTDDGLQDRVIVFGDYLAEGRSAEANARAILDLTKVRCKGIFHQAMTDPAGNSRNAVGPTVLAEYQKVGLTLQGWPTGRVADSLALLDSFISPSLGTTQLQVHPRCTHLIQALQCYRRAKKAGQWLDRPEDPQHPYEDLVDSLRGGLRARYPQGRTPQHTFKRANGRNFI